MKLQGFLSTVTRAVAFLLVLAVASCATIVSGTNQNISISSDPASATVRVLDSRGQQVFSSKTPATAVLKKGDGYFRGANYRVIIEKPGYKTQEVLLESSMNIGWYLVGNFFIGGFLGWLLIDPISGAMWTLAPEFVNASLPTTMSQLGSGAGIAIVLYRDLPADLKENLVPIGAPRGLN